MPIQNSTTSTGVSSQIGKVAGSQSSLGVVYSVILDMEHPLIKSDKNITTEYIGAIEFRYTSKGRTTDEETLPIAHPYDKNFKKLPVRNEVVEIIVGQSGQLFYQRIGTELGPNINADREYIKNNFSPNTQQTSEDKKDSYARVENTGMAKTTKDNSTKYDGYGSYFTQQQGIHKLKLYEGDEVIESRFGQSIRFSAYNNDKKVYAPTIFIRNGENAVSKKNEINSVTEEDVNKDGSTIALISNEYQLGFVPGTLDEKNASDFQTKPTAFKEYPSKLIGDQLLFSSGRLILSARNAEMIFYSKKNYGFISDGALSIDNRLGIEVNVGADTNIATNDRNINLNTGNGKINLGNKELEPIVKGNKLVDLLTELIDEIVKQNYLTPSGPSKVGPENVPAFNSIKSKLKTILSELNTTA